jgi:hypothetical protein
MKIRHITSCMAIGWLLAPAIALAQEEDGDLEATIRLMDKAEAQLPEAVTREIRLPTSVREDSAAVEASAKGLETANEARQNRGNGRDVAADARENAAADARDNASDMADIARENAENRSRANENRPDPPKRPDVPAPPNQQ